MINVSMVLHHVKHLQPTLTELRRVLHQINGFIVLKEHDCTSKYDAIFLDITHGLYSLVISDPIEWPQFLTEYQAWYQSREQWNDVLSQFGLIRLDQSSSNALAEKAYNAAVAKPIRSILKGSNQSQYPKIPNVTKAYHAVYVPIPFHQLNSTLQQKLTKDTTTNKDGLTNSNNLRSDQHIETTDQSTPYIPKTTTATTTTATLLENNKSNNLLDSLMNIPASSSQHKKLKSDNSISLIAVNGTPTTLPIDPLQSFTIYESGTYRNYFYVLDSHLIPHWIKKEHSLDIFDSSSSSSSSSSSHIRGTFIHPILKTVVNIGKIEYKG
jgi:hypothetical protein